MVPEISPHLIENLNKYRFTFVTLVQVLSMHYTVQNILKAYKNIGKGAEQQNSDIGYSITLY